MFTLSVSLACRGFYPIQLRRDMREDLGTLRWGNACAAKKPTSVFEIVRY